jgi:diaminohydroxyphosphoribosylaminopyrimidine deaminase/5-amino-6-(5-phosphoribosylamino)uracil reductase
VKVAASLDGRTALANGVSQWITGPEARRDGHHWRARSCDVLAGIGTLLADDPRLTVRDVETSRQPARIVVDRTLRLPATARVLEKGHVLVFAAVAEQARIDFLTRAGAEVVVMPDAQGKVDLLGMLEELGRREMNEVLAESGNRLNGALLRAGLADELVLYFAPHLLGDTARGMFDLPALTRLDQRIALRMHDVRGIGEDLRVIARITRPER